MDYWGSLDPPFLQKSGDISPKDHNFDCSSCLENLQSLQEHRISHLDPTIMGFSSLLANSRLNLLRVDDPRNLLGHLGLLQTTITGFPMVSEMILMWQMPLHWFTITHLSGQVLHAPGDPF